MGKKTILQSQCIFSLELPLTNPEFDISDLLGGWYSVSKLYGGFKQARGLIIDSKTVTVGDTKTLYMFDNEHKLFLRETDFTKTFDMKRLNDNVILIASKQGLVVYQKGEYKTLELKFDDKPLSNIQSLFIHKNKLIALDQELLYLIDLKDSSITSPIKSDSAHRIEVFENKIYLVSKSGIVSFDGEKSESIMIEEGIHSIRFDQKGNIWAGVDKGIKVFNPKMESMGILRFPEPVRDLMFGKDKVYVITDTSLFLIEM